jgi:hypothetical protein
MPFYLHHDVTRRQKKWAHRPFSHAVQLTAPPRAQHSGIESNYLESLNICLELPGAGRKSDDRPVGHLEFYNLLTGWQRERNQPKV